MEETKIVKGYLPGSIGRVVQLHGTYYHLQWGFTLFFEVKIARELSEFLSRYNEKRDGFWNVWSNGNIEGSITIDGEDAKQQEAHLRWFIISDALRGQGWGNKLIREAIDFCQERRYKKIYLWTFKGLKAARHLYEKNGFQLVEEHLGKQWGTEVTEQRFELILKE